MNREGAEQLLGEFHVPLHVRAHSLKVAKISYFLAQKLSEAGEIIDPETVWIAGMVHDFMRIVDFNTTPKEGGTEEDRMIWEELRKSYSGHHADVGAEILEERGEKALAKIIRKHKYEAILSDPPRTWEEKLLYYADKRVAHDQIVSLSERLEEGRRRHFPGKPLDNEEEKRRKAIHALEKEIFDRIEMNPEALAGALGEFID